MSIDVCVNICVFSLSSDSVFSEVIRPVANGSTWSQSWSLVFLLVVMRKKWETVSVVVKLSRLVRKEKPRDVNSASIVFLWVFSPLLYNISLLFQEVKMNVNTHRNPKEQPRRHVSAGRSRVVFSQSNGFFPPGWCLNHISHSCFMSCVSHGS